jgi:peroxiredoxin Q/BCP
VEACAFRDLSAEFAALNVVLLGISKDSVESHQKFADKYNLTFPLLSDPDAAVATAYGVYIEKMNYGKAYMGIDRTTFVIGEDGTLSHLFPKVKVDGHAEAVLQALR